MLLLLQTIVGVQRVAVFLALCFVMNHWMVLTKMRFVCWLGKACVRGIVMLAVGSLPWITCSKGRPTTSLVRLWERENIVSHYRCCARASSVIICLALLKFPSKITMFWISSCCKTIAKWLLYWFSTHRLGVFERFEHASFVHHNFVNVLFSQVAIAIDSHWGGKGWFVFLACTRIAISI